MDDIVKLANMVRRGDKNASTTIYGFGNNVTAVTGKTIVVKKDGQVAGRATRQANGKWASNGCISAEEAELVGFCFQNKGKLKKYRKTVLFRGRETVLSPEGVFLGGYQVAWPREDRFATEQSWKGITTAEILLLYLKNGVEPPTLTV